MLLSIRFSVGISLVRIIGVDRPDNASQETIGCLALRASGSLGTWQRYFRLMLKERIQNNFYFIRCQPCPGGMLTVAHAPRTFIEQENIFFVNFVSQSQYGVVIPSKK